MNTAMKLAMDAAVRAGADRAVRRLQAFEEARAEVRPYVGEVGMAADSAAGVYRAALEHMGHDTRELPPAALPVVFRAWTRSGVSGVRSRPRMAADSAGTLKTRAERFPHANRLR